MRIPFCTQSYRSDVLPLSAQALHNVMVRLNQLSKRLDLAKVRSGGVAGCQQ